MWAERHESNSASVLSVWQWRKRGSWQPSGAISGVWRKYVAE